jgi:hypothetical protein
MLPSGKGYALDISSLKRICSGHILFEDMGGDMLPSGKGYALDISSLKRICSGGDMLPMAKDMHWTYPF